MHDIYHLFKNTYTEIKHDHINRGLAPAEQFYIGGKCEPAFKINKIHMYTYIYLYINNNKLNIEYKY